MVSYALMLTLFGLTLSEARLGDILEKVRCDLLTNVFEDPIVSPGIRSAHLHSVFGAETFAATVTQDDLRPDTLSTCDIEMDKSMYWVPALMYEGDALPATLRIYLAHDTKGVLAPFPIGLRAKVHDPGHLEWFCIADKDGGRREQQVASKGFPGLTTSSGTPCVRWQARQQFPSCWDGRRLDSPSHAEHLAFATDRTCPDTHPIALPELRFVVTYFLPPPPIMGTLSLSDKTDIGGRTIHFDFISGWDPIALTDIL
jgi:hypothetical protein